MILAPCLARFSVDRVPRKPAQKEAIDRVLGLLDPREHRAQVAKIHEAVFPLAANAASANASLNMLLRGFNEAAEAAGQPIRMVITATKSAGAQARWIWFEGTPTAPPVAWSQNPPTPWLRRQTAEDRLLRWILQPDSEPRLGVLFGEAGSGKTAVVRRVLDGLAEGSPDHGARPNVIYVDLRSVWFAGRAPFLEDTLVRAASSSSPVDEASYRQILTTGPLVVLDGIDDVFTRLDTRDAWIYARRLFKLLWGTSARVLTTARDSVFRNRQDRESCFTHVEGPDGPATPYANIVVSDLTDAQVTTCLGSVGVEWTKAHGLFGAAHRIGALRRIAQCGQPPDPEPDFLLDLFPRIPSGSVRREHHRVVLYALAKTLSQYPLGLPATDLEACFWVTASSCRPHSPETYEAALRSQFGLVRVDGPSEFESRFRFAYPDFQQAVLSWGAP